MILFTRKSSSTLPSSEHPAGCPHFVIPAGCQAGIQRGIKAWHLPGSPITALGDDVLENITIARRSAPFSDNPYKIRKINRNSCFSLSLRVQKNN